MTRLSATAGRRLAAAALATLLWLLALPGLAAPGLTGSYFSNNALTAPATLVRIDATVPFNWGNGSPDPSLPSDNFSVRWTGYVRVQTTGSYTFQTLSDDGVRLWVNGSQVINNWTDHAPTTDTSGAVTLTAGVDYPIQLEYYERGGGAQIELRWKKPGDSAYAVIPASNGSLGLSTGLAPIADYRFEEASWNGTAGELKDIAGYAGGPYNGKAQGSSSNRPTAATASPARSGNPGTCGYASLPGPTNNGGSFLVTGLPVSTASGAQTTVAFWMYWTGTDSVLPVGWTTYALGIAGGAFGFHTSNGDLYGISSNGLTNGWHHVVAVFTNGGVSSNLLYLDGVSQTLTQRYSSPSAANAQVSTSLTIGGYGNNSSFRFVGRLDEVKVYNGAISASDVSALYAQTHACSTSVDHLEIRLNTASGLTCAPSTLTVVACKDAACTATYTDGVSGTLTATGSGMTVNWPNGANFSIPAGSGSTTVNMQLTTVGSVVVGTSGLSPAPTGATSCNFGSPQCTYSAAAAALTFNIADHVSETTANVSVAAVGSSGGSCSTAFASSTRNLTFKCSYVNPSSGSRAVRVAGSALNAGNSAAAACDATGRSVALAFNASGVASTTLQYADVGQMQLNATYTGSSATGDAGLTMTGNDRFIVAPASFGISAVTAGPIKAGSAFSATVTARNAAGATTPNFGQEAIAESAQIDFTRYRPTGAGASDGNFSGGPGAFSGGSATASDLNWSEVGSGDLIASLTSGSYLGSGFDATGSTGSAGAVGRFIPHHFDLALTAACGSFSYAGQAFTAAVTARNASGGTTVNYDGSSATSPNFAKAVTLAEPVALGVGTLGGTTIAAGAFSAGMATSATPVYSFTSKTTAPRTLVLRATDTDAVSSAGYTEGSMALRSGRLRLSNAFGSAGAALQVPVVAEHWSGSSWMLNSADSCTALAAASVALSNARSAAGGSTTAVSSAGAITLANGSGLLTLAAPSPAGSSLTLDLAINLGSSGVDQSCQANHPASTGAAKPWLRAQNGACAATADRDPAARASFGIFSPETRKTVHVRELF